MANKFELLMALKNVIENDYENNKKLPTSYMTEEGVNYDLIKLLDHKYLVLRNKILYNDPRVSINEDGTLKYNEILMRRLICAFATKNELKVTVLFRKSPKKTTKK